MSQEKINHLSEVEALRKSVVDEAMKWIGAPSIKYRGESEGITPDGFDCSGFVKFVLQRVGIKLPGDLRHTNQFFDSFGVLVHQGLQKKGDLVFFSKNGLTPTHMGILLSDKSYIQAPGHDKTNVCASMLTQTPIENFGPNVIYNTNPIGFKRITIPSGRWNRI